MSLHAGHFGLMPGFVLPFVVMAVLFVFILVRSSRRFNRTVWGESVCADPRCRHRNRAGAQFCSRCGAKLQGG